MIGLDTNVVVRYIMQDDPRQSRRASSLMEGLTAEKPGFISIVCLTELVWVLESAYGLARSQVVDVLSKLISIDALKIDRPSVVAGAIRMFMNGKADFADCLIERSSSFAGCEKTMTFDRAASRSANMEIVE